MPSLALLRRNCHLLPSTASSPIVVAQPGMRSTRPPPHTPLTLRPLAPVPSPLGSEWGLCVLVQMAVVAPNLSTLIGEMVAARLISKAGSLTSLAKCPASTVQVCYARAIDRSGGSIDRSMNRLGSDRLGSKIDSCRGDDADAAHHRARGRLICVALKLSVRVRASHETKLPRGKVT